MLSFFPRTARFSSHRHQLRLEFNPPSELTCKVARTKEELEAALVLLHDEYVRAGYMVPDPSGMRVTPYHALPSTTVLIAKWGEEVVGTVSIVRDSAFGLPLEKLFQIQKLRHKGRRLAEVSGLTIRHDRRQNRGQILFPLIKFIVQYCQSYFGVDVIVIAVHPRHLEFYESLLGFQQFPEGIKRYQFVNGAPAVGACLVMRDLYKFLIAHYGVCDPERNMHRYLYEMTLPNICFPDRRYFKLQDPCWTPELFNYFFNERTRLVESLSVRDKAILVSLYRDELYQPYLPKVPDMEKVIYARSETRFDVACTGRIYCGVTRIVSMKLRDASVNGFRAELEAPIRFGSSLPMTVAVGDFNLADLVAYPVWRAEDGSYGFRIESSTENWKKFISHLEADLSRRGEYLEASRDTELSDHISAVRSRALGQ